MLRFQVYCFIFKFHRYINVKTNNNSSQLKTLSLTLNLLFTPNACHPCLASYILSANGQINTLFITCVESTWPHMCNITPLVSHRMQAEGRPTRHRFIEKTRIQIKKQGSAKSVSVVQSGSPSWMLLFNQLTGWWIFSAQFIEDIWPAFSLWCS